MLEGDTLYRYMLTAYDDGVERREQASSMSAVIDKVLTLRQPGYICVQRDEHVIRRSDAPPFELGADFVRSEFCELTEPHGQHPAQSLQDPAFTLKTRLSRGELIIACHLRAALAAAGESGDEELVGWLDMVLDQIHTPASTAVVRRLDGNLDRHLGAAAEHAADLARFYAGTRDEKRLVKIASQLQEIRDILG